MRRLFQYFVALGLAPAASLGLSLGAIVEKPDQAYRTSAQDESISERCRMDLYLPEKPPGSFPLLIWFHGGGLEGGARNEEAHKAWARRFASQGVGIAMAGYRLSPKVRFPVYVEDAAAAVAWVFQNSKMLGLDPARIYVGGHSAGGYLAALLAMDKHYLADAGTDAGRVAGYIPMSGQMMTHFTVRKERGVADSRSLVAADEAAPIFHLRKETPPIFMMIGDRDWPARLEENRYFEAALTKVAKNENVTLLVVPDRDHGGIVAKCLEPGDTAGPAMIGFMNAMEQKK